ncbi:SgcJ/EcaC family oxidoreductase [Streptomyces sp. NPDC052051]|uniref:SgcJ/EcaC family oxidoreductase n=1 Tax=Streptomyces sp. NPDC052051 TaxID=3154649 RepID=UPI00342D98C0
MKRTRAAGVALVAAALLFDGTGAAYAATTHASPAAHPRMSANASHAPTNASHAPTKRQIAALFRKWNAALATGNAYRVADLYAPGAVLLPTASPHIRTTRAGIVDYFQHFLRREPVAVIQRQIIDVLGPTSAVNTGLYRFTLTMLDGSKTTLDARYTFVYELRHGRWLIINHHSSVVPTELGWVLSGRQPGS